MTPLYLMRHMRLEDIPQVVHIDEVSFPAPWSARTYEFEIINRDTSHLVVLEMVDQPATPPTGWRTMFQRLRGSKSGGTAAIVGYGGCWLIAGEAHISTIAVHPDYRGRGLGELLLAGMLKRSINLKGDYSVLEVRVSNLTAQALYRKYGYTTVGRRRGYYRDNGEDAFLMEARPLDEVYQQGLNQRLKLLCERVQYIDQFTRDDK
jgi:ribosomal-protein-alanine N-acetyltransferase